MTSVDASLATLEHRLREAITTRLRRIVRGYLAAYHGVIVSVPGATGVEVTGHPDLYRVLTVALDAARSDIETAVAAAWRTAATAALRQEHAADRPIPTDTLDAILADIRVAFGHAATDLTDSVTSSHDAVSGDDLLRVRGVAVAQATDRAVRRLGVRLGAAASTAVHRGYTDAQLAGYAGDEHTYLTYRKRWEVRSANPCPACEALATEGAIDLDAEFDATATNHADFTPPKVFRGLHGPPRHPNCRCRLVIAPSYATAALRQEVRRRAPGTSTRWLTAAEIRRMPEARFRALMTFLTGINTRLQTLLRRIRDGQ